jgi:hypothetical protein
MGMVDFSEIIVTDDDNTPRDSQKYTVDDVDIVSDT